MKFNSIIVSLALALTQINASIAADSNGLENVTEGKTPLAKGDLPVDPNAKTSNELNKETFDNFKMSREKLDATRKELRDALSILTAKKADLQRQLEGLDSYIRGTEIDLSAAKNKEGKAKKEYKKLESQQRGINEDKRRQGNHDNRKDRDDLKSAKDQTAKSKKDLEEIAANEKIAESKVKLVAEAAKA